MQEKEITDADYHSEWQKRWTEGRTGWDQGRHHPLLPQLLTEARSLKLLNSGDQVLEPGCGRAHGGAYLASEGFFVTSFDLTDEAIAEAKKLYELTPNLQLDVRDALKSYPPWKHKFQAIYDRAMLCALAPALRKTYLDFCFDVLSPEGIMLSLLFSEVDLSLEEGPPFAISPEALSALVEDRFHIVMQHALPKYPKEIGGKIRCETMVILKKRPLTSHELAK